MLASLGCRVRLVERSPIVAALLEDGLRRALEDVETGEIGARMSAFMPASVAITAVFG